MSIVVQATAVSTDLSIRSSVAHASAAARDCLKAAGVDPSEVDILINVGIYRDANMMEPAIGALIQKEVGFNLDYTKSAVPKAAVSFDLMNGACGALNAVQVASAFLVTGSAKRVLVVSSDAHPSNQERDGFPFATMGAAMLLGTDDTTGLGFGRVQLRGQASGHDGLEGFWKMDALSRHEIQVEVHPEFAEHALIAAESAARAYVSAEGIDLRRTFLVSSQITPTFAEKLAAKLGLGTGAFVDAEGVVGDPHSSAMTWGYHKALARKLDAAYDTVLFVAVAAGMSTACVAYRRA